MKKPIKLKKDPIFEAIFEIRFKSHSPSAADLIPGLFYKGLKDRFPKIENLPHASFQREIAKQDPNFKYKPSYRMLGESSLLLIGDQSVALSYKRPYPGWEIMKPLIMEMVSHLDDTGLVSEIERFSLKYVNILPHVEGQSELHMLRLQASLGSQDLTGLPTQIRTDLIRGDFVNIVTVAPNSVGEVPNQKPLRGLILDIDTIYTSSLGSRWEDLPHLLEDAHDTEKNLFFDVVTPETIERCDPVWEEQ